MSQRVSIKKSSRKRFQKVSSSKSEPVQEFQISLFYTPGVLFTADVTIKARNMYMSVNYDWVSRFSKEKFTILLECAEDRWNCVNVVMSFPRQCEHRDEMIRVFLAMGFAVLPYGHELVLDEKQDKVCLVYQV